MPATRMVELIKPLVRATARAGTGAEIGGFGGLFDLKAAGFHDPILVAATDGVGTKVKIAIETCRHDTIGIDLVAMSVNDLVVQGAEPLFFLDYFACGKLDPEIGAAVVKGVAVACREAGCALIGGETAEMPGVYRGDDYDLAGFAVGAVGRKDAIAALRHCAWGRVIGLASTGVHSNGYSLVRRVAADAGLTWDSPAPFDRARSLGEALLTPTRLYVRSCLAAIRTTKAVKALAHITGGGFTENIPRVLPPGLGVALELARVPVLPVFKWLAQAGDIGEPKCCARSTAASAWSSCWIAPAPMPRSNVSPRTAKRWFVSAKSSPARATPSNFADISIFRGEPDGQKARRRAHLRPWFEHDGADRGGQGAGLSGGDRACHIEPSRCNRA